MHTTFLRSAMPGMLQFTNQISPFFVFLGCDDAVRALLNYPATNVDAKSTPRGFTAVHCACLGGHIGVVGLLLSRSTSLLQVQLQMPGLCG